MTIEISRDLIVLIGLSFLVTVVTFVSMGIIIYRSGKGVNSGSS